MLERYRQDHARRSNLANFEFPLVPSDNFFVAVVLTDAVQVCSTMLISQLRKKYLEHNLVPKLNNSLDYHPWKIKENM
jgi:hypothetical protein